MFTVKDTVKKTRLAFQLLYNSLCAKKLILPLAVCIKVK